MPPDGPPKDLKSLQEIVDAVGLYPADAYLFVQKGLARTVRQIHGEDPADADPPPPAKGRRGKAKVDDVSRHITGRDLCHGLRDEAWERWGLLARTVLGRWNVTSTMDFGRIVFALVEHQHLQKTDEDTIEHFRAVFDFRTGLEAEYRIAAAGRRPRRVQAQAGGEEIDMTQDPPPAVAPVVTPSFMPARRRRAILLVLSIVFALWVATLLTMYFREVYPRRHPGTPAVSGANVQRPTLDVQH